MAADPKTIAQRFDDDLWHNPHPAVAEALLAEDVVWHHPTWGEQRGRQALLEAIREIRAAYPDLVVTVQHIVAEGDLVAIHWSITGTHRQPFRGEAPSAQRLTWEGMVLHRVVAGRIAEMWSFPHTTTHGSPHEILHRQRAHPRP
jgi:steroid delta-isomerase-like uncharacterized protein